MEMTNLEMLDLFSKDDEHALKYVLILIKDKGSLFISHMK